MSNISNISTQNIIASFAGTQRTDQARDKTVQENKQTQQHQDILQLSVHKAEDVADTSSSGDRDAQGFYLPDEPQSQEEASPEQHLEDEKSKSQKKNQTELSDQIDENLGHHLDLEI